MRRPFSCLSFFRGNIALQMVKDRRILHVRVGLRWPQAAAPPETTGLDVWRLIVILALIECFQTKLWAALAPQAWYYGQLVARTSNTGLRKNTRHWRMSSEREPHAFLCQNLQLKWGEKKMPAAPAVVMQKAMCRWWEFLTRACKWESIWHQLNYPYALLFDDD